jgi:hypothetical protein
MTKIDIVYGALILLFLLVLVWIAFDMRERWFLGWFLLGGVKGVLLIMRIFWKRQRRAAAHL